jgi:hypothetical protein
MMTIGAHIHKLPSPICEDRNFGEIKEIYDQNLNKFNILCRDLFRFYFDISGELAKSRGLIESLEISQSF